MNLRDSFCQKTQEKIIELQGNISEWSEFLDIDFPDEWNFEVVGRTGWAFREIRISCPFNRSLYSLLINLMKKHGYNINEHWTKLDESKIGDWYPYITFEKEGTKSPLLEFVFFDFHEGSICKKRQIGTIEEKKAVYEFVCE